MKHRKLFVRTGILVLLMLPTIALAHYLAFPQETSCIALPFSTFSRHGAIYCSRDVSPKIVETLTKDVAMATAQNKILWGDLKAKPIFIFCNTENEFKKYGDSYGSPATTNTKWGAYIVISKDGLDPNIIAHEMCHAELYAQLGFSNYHFGIPT